MSRSLILLMVGSLYACNSGSNPASPAPSPLAGGSSGTTGGQSATAGNPAGTTTAGTSSGTGATSWSSVSSLFLTDCASSSCHKTGANAPALDVQPSSSIMSQALTAINGGTMPQPPATLAASDKASMVAFLSGN